MPKEIKPPHWAQRLLRKMAHPDSLEEVEGDLEEFFVLWLEKHGPRKAKWKYIQTTLTLLRPFGRKQPDHRKSFATMLSMLSSYFKMSWRTLLKNKVSSMINMAGLTLGLTTSILILLVVIDEYRYDQFHTHLPNLYLLMKNQKTNEGISTGWSTAGPMAEAFRSDFPVVKYVSRSARFDGVQVSVNDKIYFESGLYAEPDLFRMMTFQAVAGDAVSALESRKAVVITRSTARRLFGDENPLGKTMTVNKHHTLMVGAVVEDVPYTSTIKFGMVVPFALYEKENEWLMKWDDNRIMTWMQLEPSADVNTFNANITELLQQRSNDETVSLFAYPLKNLHLYNHFSNGKPDGGQITAVQVLIVFGAFLLLLACINFMNIATAQSEYRAKEVGIRKVMGASRKWIIAQFLNESFMLTFLSMILAFALALWMIPEFNTLTHSNVSFDFKSLWVWALLVGMGMITALLAGSYPSFFLSSFVPVKVLKGKVRKGRVGFRKALVTFQFAISVLFLVGTVIMYAQFEHVKNRPIGYDQENLIDIRLDSMLSSKFSYLKNEASKLPNVVSVTGGSENILYSGGAVTGMDWPGKRSGEELSVVVADVEYDWTKTIGIKMVQGRDFDPAFASDASGCLINESAVTLMSLDTPVGSVVGGHPVIGVFQNFVYNNPFGIIAPMAVYLNPDRMNHLYLRVKNDAEWRQAVNKVEAMAKEISPDFPFQFSFTKEEYQNHFNEIEDGSMIITIFAGMAIFIACLGLFGLSGFIAEKRSKEMSIRKVFGAGIGKILVSLSGDFLRPVLYAIVLVIPLSILGAQKVLSNFSYRVPLRSWMFVSVGLTILFISFTIVLYHGWRTARENPMARLRDE